MIESVYITLIITAFVFLVAGFFMGRADPEQPKFLQQVILLAISTILFGAAAAASGNVEFVVCTSSSCVTNTLFFEENMYIFGFFTLIAGILTLVKSFDAFYFTQNRL